MINFDNSATTYPMPPTVSRAVYNAVRYYGGNPGRSGHKLSVKTSEMVYLVRESAAKLFDAETENVVFTLNCTHALNMAIKGSLRQGDHCIISSLEHNSVSRPVYAMSKKGISFSVLEVDDDDEVTLRRLKALIRENTRAVIMTVCSNVTGQILPYREIGRLCRKKGIVYIADAAQAAGVLPLSMNDGFDFLCMSGHKGLYGPTGTGLLISSGRFSLSTIIEGGTGATSLELEQTGFLPEQLESGTVNTVGIMGLGEGIKFVKSRGINKIHSYEMKLTETFITGLRSQRDIKIIRGTGNYSAVVSFNKDGVDANELAEYLSNRGIYLRGGYHCAGLAHKYLGTQGSGTLRFSPSVMNSQSEVYTLLNALKKYKIQ